MATKSYNPENVLERIISFIEKCDQKANILLAFIGVVMTILFSSNLFNKIQQVLIFPFLDYWKNGEGCFHYLRFLLFISLVSVFVFAGLAIYDLIKVVRPQIDNNGSLSRIYFGHISAMPIDDFMNPQSYKYEEDILQQIHINSQICTKKYKNLRKAINYIIGMILSCFIMYLFLLFL